MRNMQAALDYTQTALKLHARSCLTCMHFKTTIGGCYLVCELRSLTYEEVDCFDDEAAARAQRRAGKCKHYTPDN